MVNSLFLKKINLRNTSLRFKKEKLGYKDSNLEMLESESSALPFGDSPSYVLKYTTYNVLCKPFAQALVYYITLETKKQVFFLEYSAS